MCYKKNAAYVMWKRILWAMNKLAVTGFQPPSTVRRKGVEAMQFKQVLFFFLFRKTKRKKNKKQSMCLTHTLFLLDVSSTFSPDLFP
jgi:hypothetical protein